MSTFHSWWKTRGAQFLSLFTIGRPSSSHSPNRSRASNGFTTFPSLIRPKGWCSHHINTASFSRGCRGRPPCPSPPGPVHDNFHITFLNSHSSINICSISSRYLENLLECLLEGNVSQNIDLGPGYFFMLCRNF